MAGYRDLGYYTQRSDERWSKDWLAGNRLPDPGPWATGLLPARKIRDLACYQIHPGYWGASSLPGACRSADVHRFIAFIVSPAKRGRTRRGICARRVLSWWYCLTLDWWG